MNQRERTLAIVVGLLLAVAVGMFTWNWVSSAFRKKRGALAALENQVEDRQRVERAGQLAAERVRDYETRSLPSNLELAKSLYQDWLLDLVTDEIGFDDPMVDRLLSRPRGNVYTQLEFRVGGKGDLEQATEFLHKFYSAGHLHRIGRLTLKPARDSDDVTVDAQVQALVLPGTDRADTLSDQPSQRLAKSDFSKYREVFVARNVFGPGNEPPRLSRISQREAVLGEEFQYRIRADDPDRSGQLSFRLLGEVPEGAKIDQQSGQLSWQPEELGKYDFTVQVTDEGIPAESVEQTFTVAVVEPPVREPSGTEDEEFTYVTAVTQGQRRLVWLLHRTSGERFKLEEGDSFRAGDLRGKIQKIGARDAELVLQDRTLTVAVGQNVREGTEIPHESL